MFVWALHGEMLIRNIPSITTVEGAHPVGKDVVIIEGVVLSYRFAYTVVVFAFEPLLGWPSHVTNARGSSMHCSYAWLSCVPVLLANATHFFQHSIFVFSFFSQFLIGGVWQSVLLDSSIKFCLYFSEVHEVLYLLRSWLYRVEKVMEGVALTFHC